MYFAANAIKMKKKGFISLLLLFIVWTACKKPQGFDYRDVKNVKVTQVGFDRSTISMDLVYFNPNNFGVDLKKVDCDIYINQNFLGKYILDTTMHIDKKSEFTLPSSVSVDMKGIFKNGFNLLFSNEVLVSIKGSTKIGKAGIYVNVPFSYESRHKLKFF